MSKQDIITSVFHVEQSVIVVDKSSEFYQRSGIVERIGAAGNIVYVHVRVGTVVMTFHENQLAAL